MNNNRFAFLKSIKFYPFLIAQALSVFNENFFKNTLIVAILYGLIDNNVIQNESLAVIVGGLILMPGIFLSGFTGQLADKLSNSFILRSLKISEFIILCLGLIGVMINSIYLLVTVMVLFGIQVSVMSPIKLSYPPQSLPHKDLTNANGVLSTSTFSAVLFASVISGVFLAMFDKTGLYIGFAFMFAINLIGIFYSRQIPFMPARQEKLKINFRLVDELTSIFKYVFNHEKNVFSLLLGISWFYFLGQIFSVQIPVFAKSTLGASKAVLVLFFLIFAFGIFVGLLINDRLLKGRISTMYLPIISLFISVFAFDLFCIDYSQYNEATLLNITQFYSSYTAWRLSFDLFLISVLASMFLTPLNSAVQKIISPTYMGRVFAASAAMVGLASLAATLLSTVFFQLNFRSEQIFGFVALLNLGVAIYIIRILPDKLVKSFFQVILKFMYSIEIKGLENLNKAGKRSVIICNHVSYLDAPILTAFLPRKPIFAMHPAIANRWWIRPFLKLVEVYPIDPSNSAYVKNIIKRVKEGKQLVIFPEGRLTSTGTLMKIYEGPGMIADLADADIIPVSLNGVQHTPFASLKDKIPLLNFPNITMTIMEPIKLKLDDSLSSRKRREQASKEIFHIMENMMFQTQQQDQTLFQALLQSRYYSGEKLVIAEDSDFKSITIKKLIQSSVVLGRVLARKSAPKSCVGIMLPNSIPTLVSFFALQAYGRVAAMINFSQGANTILETANTAKVEFIVTSRRFIEIAELTELANKISTKVELVYLEDIKNDIGIIDKLFGLIGNPERIHERLKIKGDDPSTILFTSGTENSPKAVVLSHNNIHSNHNQMNVRVDINSKDILFNALPMFHSFGLSAGTILPVLNGVKVFLYPSPLHYRIVPEMIYMSNATIMFGTDTFLNGYAKMAHNYDFFQVRYIFAGAEKVQPSTKQKYLNDFGVRVLEGYGTTETSPVISVNSALEFKHGSVGRILPGMEYKLEPVEGINEGGKLLVKGPNVMLGYYYADKPGVLQPPKEGWHDTGDITTVDSDGFINIVGRAKRFANIAGEMISLTLVETLLQEFDPDFSHAVVATESKSQGEELVLITTNEAFDLKQYNKFVSAKEISELYSVKKMIYIQEMLVLGSGKTDYVGLNKLASEQEAQK